MSTSIFRFTAVFLVEKAMAPHSSTLAWKIPWTEEPGRLQSMGSRRVGHDWVTSLWLFTFMHWRRKWQPTSVFLPRESQGRGSLVGCRLWGRKSRTRLKRLSSSSSSSRHNWFNHFTDQPELLTYILWFFFLPLWLYLSPCLLLIPLPQSFFKMPS